MTPLEACQALHEAGLLAEPTPGYCLLRGGTSAETHRGIQVTQGAFMVETTEDGLTVHFMGRGQLRSEVQVQSLEEAVRAILAHTKRS